MSVLLAHPSGNSFVRAALDGLLQANELAAFFTSIATFPGDLAHQLSSLPPFAELKRRQYNSALASVTHTSPWREAGRLLSGKLGLTTLTKHETGVFSVDAVYQSIDKVVAARLPRLAKQGLKAVYAYEDAAMFSFLAAKMLGVKSFYDLPIGYWRTAKKLLTAELERWPQWAATLPNFINSETKLARKEEELRLADHIYVASGFTAGTLSDFPGRLAPVHVIPYGFPPVAESRSYTNAQNRKLKLLFVGGLSQRKGIADVFSVVSKLQGYVELTVVGNKVGGSCQALDQALTRHRWIPTLPHAGILQLMRENDVLLFPSLFEGFGLVITEAMSQGMPVITTERTAGPDLIEHGQNGWLIKAGSEAALFGAIDNLLLAPESIQVAGRAAMDTASRRPWKLYGQELAASISSNI